MNINVTREMIGAENAFLGSHVVSESGMRDVQRGPSVESVRYFNQMESATQFWADRRAGRIDDDLLRAAFRPDLADYRFGELSRRYAPIFNEAMSTSDFALLSDQILDRQIYDRYSKYEYTFTKIAKINRNIKDFRSVRRYMRNGGLENFEKVKEYAEFKRSAFDQDYKDYSVEKYAGGFFFSWEMMVNDDMNFFEDAPNDLVIAGTDSVEQFVTGLYVDANGPHASFYTAGNGNIMTGNPALSLDALRDAIAQMMDYKDSDGKPIRIKNLTLVVGSGALLVTATNLKNMLMVEQTSTDTASGASAGMTLRVNNWIASQFDIVFNPFIPIVASSANGSTSWFLFGTPSGSARPALEVGFLRGYDTPVLFRRAPDAVRISSGSLDQSHGSFHNQHFEYKGVLVYGGTQFDPKRTLASNGSGV